MKKLNTAFTFLLFFFSLTACADNTFEKELASGKSIVLIINADLKSKSEQYADWSHYLNQFSSNVGKDFVFHHISKNMINELVKNGDRFNKSYSMIFIKKGKPSYFYEGPIVEPQVYKYVKLSYSGKPIKPKYLNQFSPDKVNVEFK